MNALGVDIGQARDPSALAGVETAAGRWRVWHLERLPLGTAYSDVIDRVAELNADRVGVDATGVGRPVLETMKAQGLPALGVTITNGRNAAWDAPERLLLPKRLLLRPIAQALSGRLLDVPRTLEGASALADELKAFKRRQGERGHVGFEARGAGHHGDLVVALALAMVARSMAPPRRSRTAEQADHHTQGDAKAYLAPKTR